jgi:hypothetical protein
MPFTMTAELATTFRAGNAFRSATRPTDDASGRWG